MFVYNLLPTSHRCINKVVAKTEVLKYLVNFSSIWLQFYDTLTQALIISMLDIFWAKFLPNFYR